MRHAAHAEQPDVHVFGVLLAQALRSYAARATNAPLLVPTELRRLLLAALSAQPAARPRVLSALIEEVAAFVKQCELRVSEQRALPRPAPVYPRRPALAVAVMLALCGS